MESVAERRGVWEDRRMRVVREVTVSFGLLVVPLVGGQARRVLEKVVRIRLERVEAGAFNQALALGAP